MPGVRVSHRNPLAQLICSVAMLKPYSPTEKKHTFVMLGQLKYDTNKCTAFLDEPSK